MQNTDVAAIKKPAHKIHIGRIIVFTLLVIWGIIQVYPIFWLFLFPLKTILKSSAEMCWDFLRYGNSLTTQLL